MSPTPTPNTHHCNQMATLKQANALMADLKTVARPVSLREDAALQAFARNVTGDPSFKLLWWDNAYWAERMKEARFRIKSEELRQYLPLENVREGLFKVGCKQRSVLLGREGPFETL